MGKDERGMYGEFASLCIKTNRVCMGALVFCYYIVHNYGSTFIFFCFCFLGKTILIYYIQKPNIYICSKHKEPGTYGINLEQLRLQGPKD